MKGETLGRAALFAAFTSKPRLRRLILRPLGVWGRASGGATEPALLSGEFVAPLPLRHPTRVSITLYTRLPRGGAHPKRACRPDTTQARHLSLFGRAP